MPDHFTDEEVVALKAGLENLIEQRIDLLARIGLDPSRLSTISDTAGWINKAADAIRRLLARLEQAEARVKELEDYAREATKAITGLTVGGSEFFGKRIGEMYTADLPYCVEHIRDRDRRNHERLVAALKEPKP